MAIIQSYPGQVLPELWISGLVVSWVSTTALSISAGICRDSNNIIDMTIGQSNFEGQIVPAPLALNALANGVNGLDTGALAAYVSYAVYVIGDSSYNRPTAGLISLASNATPLMPAGYDSYRLVGYVQTDGSAHFINFVTTGTQSQRLVMYTVDIGSFAFTLGTSYVAVRFNVPPVNYMPLFITYDFNANAAGDQLFLRPSGFTADQVIITAPVIGTTAHTTGSVMVPTGLFPFNEYLDVKATSASDAVTLTSISFWLSL